MKTESPHSDHVNFSKFSVCPAAHSFNLADGSSTARPDSPGPISLVRMPLHLQVPGSASNYPVSCGNVFSTNDGCAPGRTQAWPSPSLAPGNMDSTACYSSSTSVPNNALLLCNMNTPISPDACSSAGSTFSHAVPMEDNIHICTPASDISPVEPDNHARFLTPPITTRQETSVSAVTDLFPSGNVTQRLEERPQGPETRGQQIYSSNMQKMDEPYAKLIYRAFMSRPDYSMTLQDLYQWFRENTNKAVNEKGGWQNSIRHNLSMNGAFTKPKDRQKYSSGGAPESLAESKRSTKWVLADWAVEEGVKSTTRYRKQSSGRRNTNKRQVGSNPYSRGAQALDTQTLSPRAQSGRKGGCAARNFRQNRLNFAQSAAQNNVGTLHNPGPVQRPLSYSALHGDAIQMASLDQHLRSDVMPDGALVNPMFFMGQQQQLPYDMAFSYHGYSVQNINSPGEHEAANMFSVTGEGLMIDQQWYSS